MNKRIVHVASEANSATVEPIDACEASCGSAPCGEILWTTWCGCWWGEGQQR
ncbi:hypothetical protein ENSA5_23450 [Enhygromyxa salina]|uniref:Uncharacterized protein n=1 Tax=Enhygromyxa salina TaxID=215803 RepID=A0A2S9YBB8_9BACT|nr:hypothetical protein [Enhygromyxa salina]PRQ02418.1 hypothetical protein ENSA5_23450 [Enhygromyxa salina]